MVEIPAKAGESAPYSCLQAGPEPNMVQGRQGGQGQNPTLSNGVYIKATSNNPQFVTPAPYPVRGKLRRESSDVNAFWIPVFTGMTFLEVA